MSGRHYVTTSIPYVNAAAARRARPGVRAGRRLRPLPAPAGRGTPASSAAPTRTASRTCRPPSARACRRGAGRPQRPGLPGAVATLDCQRRLHPHRRGRTATAGRAGSGRAIAAATSTKPVLGASTASAASSSTPRTSWSTAAAPTTAPAGLVEEENWFFRLSRYGARSEPDRGDRCASSPPRGATRCCASSPGLEDFTVSRSRARARGWGVDVPGDPGQVMYVWFDALANYITASLRRAEGRTVQGLTMARLCLGMGRLYQRYWLGRRPNGCTSSARASCASTPSTGRPCSSRPASRCPRTSSSTAT